MVGGSTIYNSVFTENYIWIWCSITKQKHQRLECISQVTQVSAKYLYITIHFNSSFEIMEPVIIVPILLVNYFRMPHFK